MKDRLDIRLDSDVKEGLKKRAKTESRSVSKHVVHLIKEDNKITNEHTNPKVPGI